LGGTLQWMEVAVVLYPLAVLAIVVIWIVQPAITLRRRPGRIDLVGALSWRTGRAILVIGFVLASGLYTIFIDWFSD
jgi:predicted MFS family arabinose efflux permease